MHNNEIKIKITFLGNQGVGKTSIISRYVYKKFHENSEQTMIANSLDKTINKHCKEIKLNIWNSIGQEKLCSYGKNFYKNSQLICFVYDITNEESFNSIKNVWYPQFKKDGVKNAILGVAGNKNDLYELQDLDFEEKAKKFADGIGALFMLISSKTGDGIEKLFDNFIDLYLGFKSLKDFSNNKIDDDNKNNISNMQKCYTFIRDFVIINENDIEEEKNNDINNNNKIIIINNVNNIDNNIDNINNVNINNNLINNEDFVINNTLNSQNLIINNNTEENINFKIDNDDIKDNKNNKINKNNKSNSQNNNNQNNNHKKICIVF